MMVTDDVALANTTIWGDFLLMIGLASLEDVNVNIIYTTMNTETGERAAVPAILAYAFDNKDCITNNVTIVSVSVSSVLSLSM